MIIVIFFLIIIPILIYLPSPIGIIPQEEAGNVLGYIGALFGGFITFYGVKKTIDYEVKAKQESEKPILIISSDKLTVEVLNNKRIMLNLALNNVGTYEAINCSLEVKSANVNINFDYKNLIQCIPRNCLGEVEITITDRCNTISNLSISIVLTYSGHNATNYTSTIVLRIYPRNIINSVELLSFDYK